MGTGQFFLVMLAIVLFSTLIIATQNNLYSVAYLAYKAMYSMQGYKIADRFFQEITAMNLSGLKTFEEIKTDYIFSDSLVTINGIPYYVDSATSWCNKYGEAPSDTLNLYQRVDIRITCMFANDSLFIGTQNHPVSYIYGRMGL